MADTVEIDIVARVDQALSGIGSLITKIAAAYVSVEAFKRLVVDSFKSYEEAENSQVRLGAALKATGQYSQGAYSGLLQYAKGLQDTTIFSHEAIESSAGLLLTIGHLNVQGVQAIMPHLQDFAAMYGTGLPEAARMAAAAIEGSRNGFMRYGISIKEAHDPTSRFNALLEALQGNVRGVSDALSKTTSGQLTIFKNQIKELKENFGGFMAETFLPILKLINLGFQTQNILKTPVKDFIDKESITVALQAMEKQRDTTVNLIREYDKMGLSTAEYVKRLAEESSKIGELRNRYAELSKLKSATNTPFANPDGVVIPKKTLADAGITLDNYITRVLFYEESLKDVKQIIDKYKSGPSGSPTAELGNEAEQARELAGQMQTVADAAKGFGEALASGDMTGFFQKIIAQAVDALVPMALLAAAKAAIIGDYATMAVWLGVAGMTIATGVGFASAGSSTPGASSLPHMASGGIAMSPTLAVIGEVPEAVVPLGRGMGGPTIIVQGSVWAARDLARELAGVMGQW